MTITPVNPSLRKIASTGLPGFNLINGTQAILAWAVPNDGQLHRLLFIGQLNVTVAETGGQLVVSYTGADNAGHVQNINSGGGGTGFTDFGTFTALVQPGTTVQFSQFTALTAGAAVTWGEIWGS